jgi:hypothetical protein
MSFLYIESPLAKLNPQSQMRTEAGRINPHLGQFFDDLGPAAC